MTGRERRWLNPNRGPLKLFERNLDIMVSRFLYPRLARVWNPYAWLLERRFGLADVELALPGWPPGADPLRVLLLSDVHTGIFLKPTVRSRQDDRQRALLDQDQIGRRLFCGMSGRTEQESQPRQQDRNGTARDHSQPLWWRLG